MSRRPSSCIDHVLTAALREVEHERLALDECVWLTEGSVRGRVDLHLARAHLCLTKKKLQESIFSGIQRKPQICSVLGRFVGPVSIGTRIRGLGR